MNESKVERISHLLGSLSNNDGDRNENVSLKKYHVV